MNYDVCYEGRVVIQRLPFEEAVVLASQMGKGYYTSISSGYIK